MIKLYRKLLFLFFTFIVYILFFVSFDVNDKFGIRRKVLHNLPDIKNISYDGTETSYSAYSNFDYISRMEKSNDTDYTIILGDSRLERLNCRRMYEETGEKYVNFSFGGCTLDEGVFELKYLLPRIKIKKVIFLIDFYTLNKYRNLNRVEKIPDMTICNYIFDYWNTRRMFEEFIAYVNHLSVPQNIAKEKIVEGNKDFIAHLKNVINESVPYSINGDSLDELNGLLQELSKNETEFIFFVPPVYKIYYDEMLSNKDYISISNILKHEFSNKVKVYDMQYLSELTVEERYWNDNFHLNCSGMRIVENTIIGKDNRYIKINH